MRCTFGLDRGILSFFPSAGTQALAISGIRYCGKSTLLAQLLKSYNQPSLYINFEDPRLFGFELSDFRLLDDIIAERKSEVLFFDEIQAVERWELYVRQKLDEGFKVIIAGSNAALLSFELRTKLADKLTIKEIFPFSYCEFLAFKRLTADAKSWEKYLHTGGFPELVKTNNFNSLPTLLYAILTRDIVLQHDIRDVDTLKRLAAYLISSVGGLVTAGKLHEPLGIKNTATILKFCSCLEDSYLVNFLPKFSYSIKAQAINPRKVYVVDPSLIEVASTSATDGEEQKLENMVYWELRRKGYELYYFSNDGQECDFVMIKNNHVEQLVQVCYELTPANTAREHRGLHEAMKFFNTDNGIIVTNSQTESYLHNGRPISIVPAYRFISENLALI
ncbi:MAG: ATP-binding protein [Prevotellaceae bacterium]|nr:ATP-binding protein [Prevotellaceae bacterium]